MQTAEHLAERGLIDAVVPHEEIADVADRALRVLAARSTWHVDVRGAERPTAEDGTDADDPEDGRSAWDVVTASRREDRPGVRRLLRTAATDVVGLSGTGAGEKDPGLLLALARFGGAPCVVLGQDRRGQSMTAPLGPAALREARRGMHLAEELRLPLVTLIDTPGAALSQEAEEGGLAGEIARCLQDLVMLKAPTLAVLLGQGTGGGALALVPADRVLAAANGWLGPLPRRARRRSCTATPRTPARWRRPRACGPPISGGPGSSTGWCPSGPTPPTSRPSSASGWAGCSVRNWPGCWAATTANASAAGCTATATWVADQASASVATSKRWLRSGSNRSTIACRASPRTRVCSAVRGSNIASRTASTWPGATERTTSQPASVSTARLPRPSSAERSRRTHPRSSRRATVCDSRLCDWFARRARSLIRRLRPGDSEASPGRRMPRD